MSLNWKDLEEILDEPIAYRFIDKVERLSGNVAEAIKLVSTQDWYFTMHFPGNPVVPGVFLLEMMKQTAIVVLRSLDFCFDRTGLFECERFRIFQEVRPGDIVRIVVRLERITDGMICFTGEIFCKNSSTMQNERICVGRFSLYNGSVCCNSVVEEKICINETNVCMVEYSDIEKYIEDPMPYRFIDKINIKPNEYAEAKKYISSQDWYFDEGYNYHKIVQDALLIEMLMQPGVLIKNVAEQKKRLTMLNGCRNLIIYSRPVPGDVLRTFVYLKRYKNGVGDYLSVAKVNDSIIATMEFTFVMPEEMISVNR